jgi:hypothetical protein
MKYDELLNHREELRQAAKLANIVYAHQWLGDFAARIARSGLHGEVVLRGPDAAAERPAPQLVAEDFSQAVVEEHFLADEINELHSVLAFVHEADHVIEARFRLEELGGVYVPALRRVLEIAGVLPKRRSAAAKPAKNSRIDAA